MDFLVEHDEQNQDFKELPWKIAIIDDDATVHQVTKMTLQKLEVDNKPLEFLYAFSAAEGLALFEQNPDIALAFVDVVMESENAGLELIDKVRNQLHNHTTRIILRTGQPGQAPEEKVIREYDINDYKSKTELTSLRLKTCTYSTLRSFRDIKIIEQSQLGMENVIKSSVSVLKHNTLNNFGSAVLEQTLRLLSIDHTALYLTSHFSDLYKERHVNILAATGELIEIKNLHDLSSIPEDIRNLIQQVIEKKSHIVLDDVFVGYYETGADTFSALYLKHDAKLTPLQVRILELFATNVTLMFENLNAKEDIMLTQKELILIMGDAIEARSKETGAHVRRVALMCEFIAEKLGMPSEYVDTLRFAAPLHDVGKIAIPESILHKPGKLDPEEWEIMKTHAQRGYDLLENSHRIIAKMGARIAISHHEKWDGNGYPKGLKGEEIPLEGRIMAIIDVIDALLSKRCYKEPWTAEQVKSYLSEQSGKQFDPELTKLCLEHFQAFVDIRERHPDGA